MTIGSLVQTKLAKKRKTYSELPKKNYEEARGDRTFQGKKGAIGYNMIKREE